MNKLDNNNLKHNVFSVYDYDGLSMQELLSQFFTKINECVENGNEVKERINYLLDLGLAKEVVVILTKWLNEGKLEDIINNGLFNNIEFYPILPSETGVISEKYIYGDVRRYGAVGDGVTDNTLAFKNCMKSLGGIWTNIPSTMYIPTGAWKYSEPITIERDNITLHGDGMEQTILLPQGCDGVRSTGSKTNTRYGVIIKDFAVSGGVKGLDTSYIGLNSKISNISIHSCVGVGYYCRSGFDHIVENIMVREAGEIGFYINQLEEPFEEISYITFNNCVAVNCNNNNVQWSISGNNIYLNNCKANECSLGVEFLGNVWACRINNFYMDGIDTNSVMFKVNSGGARNITIQNVYGWNVGYIIQASQGRSIIGRNLDVNPSSWAYKALKVDNTYTGVIDIDNKNYVIEDNRSDKKPYLFFGDFANTTGQRILVKEVEIDMYVGGEEFSYTYTGADEEQIQNIFVTPMSDVRYIARDGVMANEKCVPLIYSDTNKQGYYHVKILCHGAVKERVTAKLQLMIVFKPNKPFQ